MFVLVSSFVFVSVTVFISVSVKAFIKQFIKTYMSEFFRKNLPESPSLRNSVLTYTINYCIISTVKEIQTPKDETKKGGYTDVSDYDTERQHQFYF